jgi:protein-disulfide isomerase
MTTLSPENSMSTKPDPSSATTGLSSADHSAGAEHASLLLLEYGDFECPACAEAEPVTRHLLEVFGSRMRFVYRHYPLVEVHPHAELAAEASEAAAAQGKFWPMHHLLFTHAHHLTLDALTRHAQTIGLDMLRFNAEMADRIYTQRVQEHRRAGQLAGLRASPSFFLNGKLVDVSFGLARLEQAVRTALGEPAV